MMDGIACSKAGEFVALRWGQLETIVNWTDSVLVTFLVPETKIAAAHHLKGERLSVCG